MLNTIVLPLDGSRFAESAAPLARSIAAAANAELHLVLVREHLPAVGEETYEELLAWHRKGEDHYLTGAADRFAPAGRTCASAILEGDTAEAVAGYAGRHAADLIVLGTHGWGAVKRFWLGSVADRLVRQSHIPILLVRPQEDGTALEEISSITVALDRAGFGEAVLPVAVELALALGLELHLVHVVQPPLPLDGSAEAYTVAWDPGVTDSLVAGANEFLSKVAAKVAERGCRVDTRVLVAGLVAESLLEQAAASGSILALATHADRGIRRVFLGSVTDKVIRGSDSAVLLAHPG